MFRYTPSGHYRLRLRLNDGGTNAQLQEVSGTTTTNLATNSAFTPTLRQWYHLEVQVEEVSNGVQIRAYIDGQLVISHTDTTPRDPALWAFTPTIACCAPVLSTTSSSRA